MTYLVLILGLFLVAAVLMTITGFYVIRRIIQIEL